MRLQGKVAIVTGGAHGMGEAEARLFAKEGAQVVVADILAADAEKVGSSSRSQARR
jgi:NAD(P)-dependent dehydrogenase (short-subunit alcohol dehydrogenase family)